LFAQKKEQEKGPRLYRPFGLSCASRCWRDAENSPPTAAQTSPASFSVNSCDAQRHRTGLIPKR